jgi:hypothetical protein
MIAVAALVLAVWPVVGDAPWEDGVTEAKQWAVGPQWPKRMTGPADPQGLNGAAGAAGTGLADIQSCVKGLASHTHEVRSEPHGHDVWRGIMGGALNVADYIPYRFRYPYEPDGILRGCR